MYELDIFSIDEDGNVIVTTIVGDDDSENNKLIADYIDGLPNISRFERVREDNYDFSDWDAYAKKGIIAYDNYFGKNVLTSRPTSSLTTLTIDDLPMEIIKLFECP